MKTLLTFDSTSCPKCGADYVKMPVRYHGANGYCTVNSDDDHFAVDPNAREHLHYTCKSCQFDWGTQTKDAAA